MSAPAGRIILGVDFSGAADAGRRIWIAEGRSHDSGLVLSRCIPARNLPGGGIGRKTALAALAAHIRGCGEATVGLDFPFGLPAALVAETRWEAFVRDFHTRWPTPEAFRAGAHAAAGNREIRRRTDHVARTPFCPWNLRLYRQTWHGIADLLAPLVAADAARAVPMQRQAAGKPLLLEACPASFLKREELYRPYKGRGAALRTARANIVDTLTARGRIAPLPRHLRAVLLDDPGGDALDAALAALCALRAMAGPSGLHPADATERIEARVYF